LFSLEHIRVRTGSAGTTGNNLPADVEQWHSASYVRNASLNLDAKNHENKTRYFRAADLETPGNRRYAKFSFFLQGGYDGTDIFNTDKSQFKNNAIRREIDNASDQGGVNGPTTAAYRKAIDVMGVKSEVDIKLLAIPGIRVPSVTDFATTAVENRFDALYLMDIEQMNSSNKVITGSSDLVDVKNTVQRFKNRGLDSSFAAAYFPDVVLRDPTTDNLVVAPSTTAVLGAFSLNDAIAHPWFAPAGFTRGALNAVEGANVRLSRKNLDDLYDVDINPLTSFPGTGVVVYGQKTLQANASALDRINVRRLLINVRRSVRQVANSLLFEPNRQETLDKFSSLVNPILQRVQEQGGVDRYRVIIDTSTTTQADVENNTIRGKIFLQPTRTVEFIALDFVVTNAGANI
jgi:phage tail sheath protein FI